MTNAETEKLYLEAYQGNTTSLQQLQQAAQKGNPSAQNWLGGYYSAKKHYRQGNAWYRKAAEQGYADAEDNIGDTYYFGRGVPQNYVTANTWYRKAAEQGNAFAECNLGRAYYFGEGVPKSITQAIFWFKKAKSQGFYRAKYYVKEAEEGNYKAKLNSAARKYAAYFNKSAVRYHLPPVFTGQAYQYAYETIKNPSFVCDAPKKLDDGRFAYFLDNGYEFIFRIRPIESKGFQIKVYDGGDTCTCTKIPCETFSCQGPTGRYSLWQQRKVLGKAISNLVNGCILTNSSPWDAAYGQ